MKLNGVRTRSVFCLRPRSIIVGAIDSFAEDGRAESVKISKAINCHFEPPPLNARDDE
jgi:hypothetical protein